MPTVLSEFPRDAKGKVKGGKWTKYFDGKVYQFDASEVALLGTSARHVRESIRQIANRKRFGVRTVIKDGTLTICISPLGEAAEQRAQLTNFEPGC